MSPIILLPALVCWVVLARGTIRQAFIYVYLPAILLLPQYYIFRPPHMPPITFGDAAILPLGVALFATELRRWRLQWMDLWVFLFVLGSAASEALSSELASGDWVSFFTADSTAKTLLSYNVNNGIFQLFADLTVIILPYMLGKLLIEEGEIAGRPARKAFVSRLVVLLAIVGTVSIFDFLTGTNSWQRVFRHLFPDQFVEWSMQIRWGFGRIAGPFAHAILAGMIFLTGLIYCLWLRSSDPKWGTRRLLNGLPLTKRAVVLPAVFAGLLMTQSRGPWMGVALALLFAVLIRVLPVRKAAVAFAVLLAMFGTVAFLVGDRYTTGTRDQAASEEQSSAIYRRQLLQSYTPVVQERMAFGWGISDFPAAGGQRSIDNQYLWLAVTRGFVGMGLFLIIGIGSGIRLVDLAGRPMFPEDRMLVYAHMAVLLGLMTTFATVYMGEQVVPVFFLVIGWMQAVNPARVGAGVAPALGPQFKFRRVLG
jgi:hypothetical protein